MLFVLTRKKGVRKNGKNKENAVTGTQKEKSHLRSDIGGNKLRVFLHDHPSSFDSQILTVPSHEAVA